MLLIFKDLHFKFSAMKNMKLEPADKFVSLDLNELYPPLLRAKVPLQTYLI